MNKNFLKATFAGILCVFSLMALPTRAADPPAADARRSEGPDLFARPDVPQIQIEIAPEGIEALRKYRWQFGQQKENAERPRVPAIVKEGGRTYTNVTVRLKGAAGSFRPIDENPCLTLNFDTKKGSDFHELTKLSVNNSVQDPTYVSEQFSRETFLAAGVPVPRATHAKVELNGRPLGLYVLTEGYDKRFLRRHFKNVSGNLYDGGFLKDINVELDTNSGDAPQDQADRLALLDATKEADLDQRLARLEKVLDVERFLTYVALEVMLWDWDGYPLNRNNWRLFHDRDTGKMVFMPHGLDQMFWQPEGSIFPSMQGIVAKALMEVPSIPKRYFAKVKQLRATVFNPEAMSNRVQQLAAKVNPVLAQKEADAAQQHRSAVDEFCQAIVKRGRSIEQQLVAASNPVQFDAANAAPLAHWEAVNDFGQPRVEERKTNAVPTLFLGTRKGSSIGAWRSRVWLPAGRYQLEARVRYGDVVPDAGDPRGGVGMRVGSARPEKYRTGTGDWQAHTHEFEVKDPLAEVQILCEFRARQGEAEFERNALRLTRLPAKEKSSK